MKSCCDEYCSTHGCNQGRDCPVRIERVRQAKELLDTDEQHSGWFEIVFCVAAVLIGIWLGWVYYNAVKVAVW
jgi:hypothetical protein